MPPKVIQPNHCPVLLIDGSIFDEAMCLEVEDNLDGIILVLIRVDEV